MPTTDIGHPISSEPGVVVATSHHRCPHRPAQLSRQTSAASDGLDTPTLASPGSVASASTVASEDDASSLAATGGIVSAATSSSAVRPRLGNRKTSSSMIVPRDAAVPLVVEDDIDEDDVRNMSPRRNSAELARLAVDARRDLIEQARVLQTSLQAIVDRVETVKSEHEKLEGGNRFLQSYIGELMQTSRIASSAPSKSKGKGRSGK